MGLNHYGKCIQYVDDIWDSKQQDFLTWERTQEKFNLTPTEARIGTSSLMNFLDNGTTCWRPTRIPPTQSMDWILRGGGGGGGKDLAFVIQCIIEFCTLLHATTSYLYATPDALGNGKTPKVIWLVFFMT